MSTMTSRARKTWISIAIAAAVLVIALVVVLVGGGMYFARHYVASSPMEAQNAAWELDRIAARFADQTPLLEQHGRDIVVNRDLGRPRQPIRMLRMVTYDARGGQMNDVTIPGWLLHWLPERSRITFGMNDGLDVRSPREDDDLEPSIPRYLKIDDLERHGPGLVFDGRESRHDARVLIWAE
jgi:hypothetical protein